MNSVEQRATAFEWKIKFPDGIVWTIQEVNQRVVSAESTELGHFMDEGMNILTFLRRALHGGGTILSVKEK